MSKMNKVIREMLNLRGKEVSIFGQKTVLSDEIGITTIDVVEVLENLKQDLYVLEDETISRYYDSEELKEMDLDELMNLYEEVEGGKPTNYIDLELFVENGVEYEKEVSIEEYIDYLCDNDLLEELDCNNTYNWNSPISNDIDFRVYVDKLQNRTITELKVHKYGDVRGNYSECIYLEGEHEYLLEALDVQKNIEIEINGIQYVLTTSVLKESNMFDVCEVDEYNNYEYKFEHYIEGDTIEELKGNLMELVC